MSDRTVATLKEMLEEIDALGDGLTQWEINFVASMIDNRSTFSTKEADIIERIHRERVGGGR